MFVHPDFDPVAISLGPLKVHWYGIMYLLAFISAYWLVQYRTRVQPLTRSMTPPQVSDWLFYGAIGVVLGGRIGYCLFYQPQLFLEFDSSLPWWGVLKIHQGGMSFHGGLLGASLAMWLHARSIGVGFLHQADFISPVIPVGLFFGRIGNFINGELWGRATDVPWAMIFPRVDNVPRHPSMLYEAFLEGLVLWALLWWFSAKKRPRGAVSSLLIIGYGVARFVVEFVRVPDEHLNYIWFDWVTMGQILSLPMILLGLFVFTRSYYLSVKSQ